MSRTNRIVETLGYTFGFIWKFALVIVLMTDKFPPSGHNVLFAMLAAFLSFISMYHAIVSFKNLMKSISEKDSAVEEVYSNIELFIQALK